MLTLMVLLGIGVGGIGVLVGVLVGVYVLTRTPTKESPVSPTPPYDGMIARFQQESEQSLLAFRTRLNQSNQKGKSV